MNFTVSYIYRIKDRYSKTLSKINRHTDKFVKRQVLAQKKTEALSKSILNSQGVISSAGSIFATMFPIKKAMEFQSAMADISKVIDLTPAQYANLSKAIKSSAVEMGRIPTQTAAIVESAGKLGIPLKQLEKLLMN